MKNGTVISLGYNLAYEGRLSGKSGAPVLIFSGMACDSCDLAPEVFVYSISTRKTERFAYPGELATHDEKEDEKMVVAYKSRLFWGNCLPSQPPSVVAIYSSLLKPKKWNQGYSMLVLQDGGSFSVTDKKSSRPPLATIVEAVKTGQCKEVEQAGTATR